MTTESPEEQAPEEQAPEEQAPEEQAEEQAPEEPQLSEREQEIERIADAEHEAMQAEAKEGMAQMAIEEGVVNAEPIEEEPAEEPDKYTVKIDGEESEVTLDELKANYQKRGFADRQIEESTSGKDTLANDRIAFEKEQADWKASRDLQDPKEPDTIEPTSKGLSVDEADSLATAFDDLSVGSDEERVKASETILNMMAKGRGDNQAATQINSEEITSQAVQQVKRQMQFDTAERNFATDFEDISNDPTLLNMANAMMREEAGTSNSYEEAFTKAGDKVRKWKNDLVESSEPKPNLSKDKSNLQSPPARMGNKAKPKPQPTVESDSDIIEQMRRDRGQI